MPEDEQLDIFDDNMNHIGTASRHEVHAKGYWHQSFHCWLVKRSRDRQSVLFQKRGPQKLLFPNALDITAAGHLLAGESPADGIRELNEELGLHATASDLVHLGLRCDVATIGAIINREFCHTFLLDSLADLDSYNLQLDEVAGLVEMDVLDGLRLFAGESQSAPVWGFHLTADGKKEAVHMDVGVIDVIPRLDRYYLKVFIMAERYFRGVNYLGI